MNDSPSTSLIYKVLLSKAKQKADQKITCDMRVNKGSWAEVASLVVPSTLSDWGALRNRRVDITMVARCTIANMQYELHYGFLDDLIVYWTQERLIPLEL